MQSRYSVSRRIDSYHAECRPLLLQHRRSLAYREVKDVKLECSFLPNSQWGSLDREPAWLLYMDFQISQPGDSTLESATVSIVFQEDGLKTVAQVPGVFVTDHFGPRNIDSRLVRLQATTQEDDPGATWTIRGSSWPLKDDDTGLRRRAEWVLEHANDYNSFRLGLILHHKMQPFLVVVSLEGRLKSHNQRWYRFRQWTNRERGLSFKVTPSVDCQASLDEIAAKLDHELTTINIENYYRRHSNIRVVSRDLHTTHTSVRPDYQKRPSSQKNTAGHRSQEDYTIAWICALPVEMAAAEASLDEVHPSLPVHPSDHNQYTLGRIGEHNVVIVCLPHGSHGVTSAVVVATHLQTSFTKIRAGLMVGIGGGVPSNELDIRLGDVVVSKPTGRFGGVVKYDAGRRTGPKLELNGMLNKPPQALLTATAALRSKHLLTRGNEILHYVDTMLARYPDMKEQFATPGQNRDRLFPAEYRHIEPYLACEHCDAEKEIPRRPRSSQTPKIHHGLIGSGDQLMRDGIERDRIAKDLGILCFEMEAGGLMDTFPCIVIRGISDYADSHKNDQWQGYAAATASGYAKALLSVISSVRLHSEPIIQTTAQTELLCPN